MTAAEKYADIINLPGPQRDELFLRRHPRMPLPQRAKIFSPFVLAKEQIKDEVIRIASLFDEV